ncbi:acyltransferase [Hyalangium sp.]|uniref:acyltransferase family protein n=1 Tax=Hyalangium sp. TaxID=2028555 RepID=UPI002D5589BD|nr:acyltransferase [Hyalangium sp.]HYH94898.1 acyltransferase [Hyalangium sp.]
MSSSPSPTLRQCLDGKRNNLDFIRFVAAAGVIFSHAFPLGEGLGTREPLEDFTRGQVTLGRLCVAVFLVISGLLITQSYERSPNLARYLWARVLRIFPGLAVVLLASMFLLGPAMTTLPLGVYFQSPDTYLYFLRNLTLYQPQWNLPGVFPANAYPGAVNGSLWTLVYEAGFYVLVAGLGAARLLRRPLALAGWVAAAVVPFVPYVGPRLNLWPELYLYFGGGLTLYLLRERVRLSPWVALGCVVALVVTARLGVGFRYAVGSCGAYLVLYLGFLPSRLAAFARYGDFSYGVYIYAFPVQQLVTALMGGRVAWWVNAAVSLPAVVALAALSWHLVEKKALELKGSPPALLTRLFPGGARAA